ncbi:MAG: DNA polymerase III subunit delta [Chromatocurvus sp.]
MRIYPEKLKGDLQKRLLPVYLVSGDETLLVQECADSIRAAARERGCSERIVMDAGRGFDWQELLQHASNLSLFSQQQLLELRLPDAKPGSEGSKALCSYLDNPSPDNTLLIVAGKLDSTAANSKWFRTIDSAGATLSLWPVNPAELPRWLQQRASAAGLTLTADAAALLAERTEGNLLAAAQEIEKLALLGDNQRIDIDSVTDNVLSSARFGVFSMVDTALAGDARSALRMLQGLRAEGVELAVVMWVLARELRLLQALVADCAQGKRPQQALQQHRVWKSRMGAVGAALERHDRRSLSQILQLGLQADAAAKGYGPGDAWQHLETLLLAIARRTVLHPVL